MDVNKRIWMFQGNPKRWNVSEAFKDPEVRKQQVWEVPTSESQIYKLAGFGHLENAKGGTVCI